MAGCCAVFVAQSYTDFWAMLDDMGFRYVSDADSGGYETAPQCGEAEFVRKYIAMVHLPLSRHLCCTAGIYRDEEAYYIQMS
ncbi:unnamed protein product [Vitrella brassicaformis CCMP3155]|uniref:Uncharacterized protein n=1 Tax=Vitrella brassicaformis (strain CCMP3155) TaxID=1169540 RepID=A0A0G4GE78_VITBC|nr:unnamed protein product [Vitrella brassicaformis CCMP3155]|eukprot:CEM27670.1 unnamed protein product [Vitrella brassicaformis CCMP3155]